MRKPGVISPDFPLLLVAVLPMVLWAVVWLTVIPNSGGRLLSPFGAGAVTHALQDFFPFLAALIAAVVILTKLSLGRAWRFGLLSPLGLASAYGLVGLAFAWKSPDGIVALRWAALYLSVPLVVWAIVWGSDALINLRRVINLTWLIIILATTALFVVGLVKLDLLEVLLNPTALFQCSSGNWYDLTAGQLRDTGVGRYSGISAIVSLAGLWHRRWRLIWVIVFVASVIVLLYSGARSSYMGFAAGAALVVLVNGGLRGVAVCAAAIVLVVTVAWSSGYPGGFIGQCIFRSAPPSPVEQPPANLSPVETTGPASTKEGPSSAVVLEPKAASQLQELESSGQSPDQAEAAAPEQRASEPPIQLEVTSSELISAQAPPEGEAGLESSRPDLPDVPAPSQLPSKGRTSLDWLFRVVPKGFFTFTGRTQVWAKGWNLFKGSPFVGHGFHADRLLLGTHMHNSLMHALVQTGVFGTIPFVAAIFYAWYLLIKRLRNLAQLTLAHKHLIVQTGGILAFLTMRAFPESTGAFFGIDWIILAPLLLYLHLVNLPQNIQETNQ